MHTQAGILRAVDAAAHRACGGVDTGGGVGNAGFPVVVGMVGETVVQAHFPLFAQILVERELEHMVFAALLAERLVQSAFGGNSEGLAVVCATGGVEEGAAVEGHGVV